MISETTSIDKLPVTFKSVLRKHKSAKSGRIHYQVRAVLATKKGPESHDYWYGDHKSFLQQKSEETGRVTVRVNYSASQRAQISKLVKGYEAKQA
jgi:hypothetical protein